MSDLNVKIGESWKKLLIHEFQSDYFKNLKNFLIEEKKLHTVYPPGNKIFAAFDYTAFEDVKVVILGQDPYHGENQANGLCFSVSDGVKQPPSLINIFKEIESDLGIKMSDSGNLEKWAKQGVLLLNATLTVRANQAASHQNKGWEIFTDKVISLLSEHKKDLIFILWGSYAQAKIKIIDQGKHHILKSVHPSPLSVYRGFYGCKHFSKANEILKSSGKQPIDWQI